jgi:thiamine transport system ATP-binding protein
MLKIEDCRLAYPDFVARYSLSVGDGILCAVVGPSGGGKTTLLHMIAGFETPTRGILVLDGVNLIPLKPSDRPVSLVFQDHNLFPHLTAAQNIGLGIRPSLRLGEAEKALVHATIQAVDLGGLADRRPGDMSGGQRQRVALARALASGRRLLLLDEPFGALDPGLRRSMIRLVDRLRRENGMTVLMTIHTPEDVIDIAEQMVFVAEGEVIASGEPSRVLDPLRDRRIRDFCS